MNEKKSLKAWVQSGKVNRKLCIFVFMGFVGLSSKMCKLIFRRSYDRHIYYLKLNQRVAPHHFYKPHIKVTYHALSGTGNR